MAKPKLADSVVQAALEERCGEGSALRKLAEGLDSQAYGFCQGDAAYVVRINRSSRGFRKDAFVCRKFARPMLPVPEIVDIALLGDAYLCISRRAPGVRVHDLTPPEFQKIMASETEVVAAISTSDLAGTHGFGRFDAKGTTPHRTWQSFLTSVADPQQFDWKEAPGVDLAVVRAAIRLVTAFAERCPERRCLIHGDFGSYNLMTDYQRITAVIDWDRALFGDPLYELANLLFWPEGCLEPLTLALAAASADEPGAAERLLCYQLRIGLQELYESATGETPVDIAWLTARCKASSTRRGANRDRVGRLQPGRGLVLLLQPVGVVVDERTWTAAFHLKATSTVGRTPALRYDRDRLGDMRALGRRSSLRPATFGFARATELAAGLRDMLGRLGA